jgi:hypothetical protein
MSVINISFFKNHIVLLLLWYLPYSDKIHYTYTFETTWHSSQDSIHNQYTPTVHDNTILKVTYY